MGDKYTVTMESGGEEQTFEGVTIRTVSEARKISKEIRENAPDQEYLTDGTTCDIDEVIDALERAKELGVDAVKVNDDGQTRHIKPVITNNHIRHHGLRPPPKTLFEWVEL